MSSSNTFALPRAVILTTFSIMYQAVRKHLTDLREEVFEGTVYERGKFSSDSQSWDILVLETGFEIGQVNTHTATETTRVISYFEPLLIIYISLAQGFKDVDIGVGDVVVATRVYGYEPSKGQESFLLWPELEVSHTLVQRARAEAKKSDWLQRLSNIPDPSPRVFVSPIISGETILRSFQDEAHIFIRQSHRNIRAVDIGAYGVLKTAQAAQLDALIVNAITDIPDSRKYVEDAQEIATQNASAFAFETLAKVNPSEFQQKKQYDVGFPQQNRRAQGHPDKPSDTSDETGEVGIIPKSTRWDQDPLPIQYLGRRGATDSCLQALATILMSPYSCRGITVVFREQLHGEDPTGVCFVIWDWLGREITIVPDGFRTQSETGGWGLAVALGLIQFYQIPLQEKWVEADQFERIANGYPTERDCEHLHQAVSGTGSWHNFRRDFGSLLWSQVRRETSPFPYWLVEPELLNDIKDLQHHPGSAVLRAMRRLEILIRDMGAYPAERIGQALINEAMGAGKPLEPHGATLDERIAWANLFRGAIGAFKNPESHRDQQLKLEDAIGQILAVNALLRKLKQDFPDKFRKEEHTNSEGEKNEEAPSGL